MQGNCAGSMTKYREKSPPRADLSGRCPFLGDLGRVRPSEPTDKVKDFPVPSQPPGLVAREHYRALFRLSILLLLRQPIIETALWFLRNVKEPAK